MEFSQKPEFKALKMSKITDFDLLKLLNLIIRKIYVSKNEHLGILALSHVEFSQKFKLQGLLIDQNCSFKPSKFGNFDFT